MSGGSMNYIYLRISEAAGLTEDKTIAHLLTDLSKVLHDEEWADCCDISDEEYQDTLRKFKKKWLEQKPQVSTTYRITESNQQITKSLQDSLKAGGNNATMLNYELSAIDRRLADISVTLAMIVDRLGGESE